MPARTIAWSASRSRAVLSAAMAAAACALYAVQMRPLLRAAWRPGALCASHPTLLAHCASCYVAAALIAAAGALALSAALGKGLFSR